uniref:Uncharacterized protein n=1 Tax=Siphoviridae sp. ctkzC12 TaxID=2826446 RepID=A0A8S5LVN3_9CAUD|nr:MAG TPA: hypothetical protein [Siphoviridae sp. ctkzC12]
MQKVLVDLSLKKLLSSKMLIGINIKHIFVMYKLMIVGDILLDRKNLTLMFR